MDEKNTNYNRLSAIDDESFIFGSLFMLSNQLQTALDREFQPYDMTTKQWFLSILIGSLFDEPPTLGEAAQAMGSTHQNVKQVALKLCRKGFLEFLPDASDGRALRLRLTQKSQDFWVGLQRQSEEFYLSTFEGLSEEEKAVTRQALAKIMANVGRMNKSARIEGEE